MRAETHDLFNSARWQSRTDKVNICMSEFWLPSTYVGHIGEPSCRCMQEPFADRSLFETLLSPRPGARKVSCKMSDNSGVFFRNTLYVHQLQEWAHSRDGKRVEMIYHWHLIDGLLRGNCSCRKSKFIKLQNRQRKDFHTQYKVKKNPNKLHYIDRTSGSPKRKEKTYLNTNSIKKSLEGYYTKQRRTLQTIL